MKNTLLLLAFVITAFTCVQAQSAKIADKDTFQIVMCSYGESLLDQSDWPDTIVVESESDIFIGKRQFHKTTIASIDITGSTEPGEVRSIFTLFNVVCNKKNTQVMKIVTGTDRTINTDYSVRKYIVENQSFYVIPKQKDSEQEKP